MTTSRHDWQRAEVSQLFELPLMQLLYDAHTIHRENFDENAVQTSNLLSIKTGACPEDCGYCSQSGLHKTKLEKQKLMPVEDVLAKAKLAKENGATRFCMGAAWRSPPAKAMGELTDMIKGVRELGLETCLTAGMLSDEQAAELKASGLDYYNHNLDTSPEYYDKVITTRTYQDRLDTLQRVRDNGIAVCCGGILGMGETRADRVSLLCELANLEQHPESVPINHLVPIAGTPLGNSEPVDNFEFIRTIAIARIMMPKSMVRLSAGRLKMSDEMQALCFFAGANSIFIGEKYLTAKNSEVSDDMALLNRLGVSIMTQPALTLAS